MKLAGDCWAAHTALASGSKAVQRLEKVCPYERLCAQASSLQAGCSEVHVPAAGSDLPAPNRQQQGCRAGRVSHSSGAQQRWEDFVQM